MARRRHAPAHGRVAAAAGLHQRHRHLPRQQSPRRRPAGHRPRPVAPAFDPHYLHRSMRSMCDNRFALLGSFCPGSSFWVLKQCKKELFLVHQDRIWHWHTCTVKCHQYWVHKYYNFRGIAVGGRIRSGFSRDQRVQSLKDLSVDTNSRPLPAELKPSIELTDVFSVIYRHRSCR